LGFGLSFLTWIQASALGHFMRDSGAWTYAIVNLAHILGIATLFGSVLMLDLRMMGAWRRIPLPAIAAAASPLAAAGFGTAVVSGLGLLSANATDYAGNPFLAIKFPAIAIGLLNAVIARRSAAWRASGSRELTASERRRLAIMGGTSLACWLAAIGAGRMIGYW
jgi:hypothetical protein